MSIGDAIGGLYAAIGLCGVGLCVLRLRHRYYLYAVWVAAWASLAGRLSVRWFVNAGHYVPALLAQATASRYVIFGQLQVLLILTLIAFLLEWEND